METCKRMQHNSSKKNGVPSRQGNLKTSRKESHFSLTFEWQYWKGNEDHGGHPERDRAYSHRVQWASPCHVLQDRRDGIGVESRATDTNYRAWIHDWGTGLLSWLSRKHGALCSTSELLRGTPFVKLLSGRFHQTQKYLLLQSGWCSGGKDDGSAPFLMIFLMFFSCLRTELFTAHQMPKFPSPCCEISCADFSA